MKKTLALVLCVLLALSLTAMAETDVDAVSSASTLYYFDGLDDGAPNIAFFVYAMVKLGDTYYVQLGLNPNQTTLNIDNGSALMAMYGCSPEAYPYASRGVRMVLSRVESEDTLTALSAFSPAGYTPLYYEVTKVVPMG